VLILALIFTAQLGVNHGAVIIALVIVSLVLGKIFSKGEQR
jgi:hypothetical protein